MGLVQALGITTSRLQVLQGMTGYICLTPGTTSGPDVLLWHETQLSRVDTAK